jgi:hypothetical protein
MTSCQSLEWRGSRTKVIAYGKQMNLFAKVFMAHKSYSHDGLNVRGERLEDQSVVLGCHDIGGSPFLVGEAKGLPETLRHIHLLNLILFLLW